MMSKIPPVTDEAEIQRQIAEDPDDDEELAQAKPFAEVFPELAGSIRRSRGRPPKANAELAVTLPLERFKSQGPDWRARMGAALKRTAGR
jgi:uncharacterized protein (DUF4415 family)